MDVRKYLGIPFADHGRDQDGCDCWGLCCLVYRQEWGIALPDMGDAYSDAYARGEVDAAFLTESAAGWCVEVTGQEFKQGDIMVFRRGGLENHAALYLEPGKMLHQLDGTLSCVARYDSPVWRNKLSRVFRHAAKI